MTTRHFLPLLPLLLPITLPAQKAESAFEWSKRGTKICYETLPVGQHTLEDLKVGSPWRLGASHDASTWQPTMPILAGDSWLAPGAYRITLVRQDETRCAIVADGSHSALGGREAVQVLGTLAKIGKPSKRLSIDVGKKGAAVAGNQPAQIVIQFGLDEWRGDVLVLGNKTVSLPGGKLAVFSVPAARVEQGSVPIATWSTGKDADGAWNVVLEQDKVRLVPWMQAPKTLEDQVVPPESGKVIQGTVTPVDTKPEKALEALELREATLAKGELRLVVAYGEKMLECRLAEPKKGK